MLIRLMKMALDCGTGFKSPMYLDADRLVRGQWKDEINKFSRFTSRSLSKPILSRNDMPSFPLRECVSSPSPFFGVTWWSGCQKSAALVTRSLRWYYGKGRGDCGDTREGSDDWNIAIATVSLIFLHQIRLVFGRQVACNWNLLWLLELF